MSILTRCDGGCGAEIVLAGPNTSAVPIPPDWVQLSIERAMKPTLTQHQCPRCFKNAQDAAFNTARERPQEPPPGLPGALPGKPKA